MLDYDVIVVGSGPAGTHASFPLVKAGLRVAMVDGGHRCPDPPAEIPALDYETMRRTREDQHRWFLGDDYSGIPLDEMGHGIRGGIVSGRRSYVVAGTDRWLPTKLRGVEILQSLAVGGLGAVWGGVCAYYSADELTMMGLPADEMRRHYGEITRRIGVSGPGTRDDLQPPCDLDDHARLLVAAYGRKRKVLDALDVELVQPYTAVLTRPLGNRKPTAYRDMDYWFDPDRSVYRPEFSLEELSRYSNFTYRGGCIVERVVEDERGSAVVMTRTDSSGQSRETLRASRIVMAAGAVGSARVLLRSFNLYDQPAPFLGKPHWLTACLHPRTLARAGQRERVSLCQLLLVDKQQAEDAHLFRGYAQLYSYKSLGLSRMLNFVPATGPESLKLLSLLVPSMVIADVRFPVQRRKNAALKLCRKGQADDYVDVEVTADPHEFAHCRDSLARLNRGLRALGLLALKQKPLPHASAAHMAGTIPVGVPGETAPLTVDSSGKLSRGQRIYVADSSSFRFMPAKSINMTIMANANRVGERVCDSLRGV